MNFKRKVTELFNSRIVVVSISNGTINDLEKKILVKRQF